MEDVSNNSVVFTEGTTQLPGVPLAEGGKYRFERLDPKLIRWSRFYNRTAFSMSEESEEFRAFLEMIEASKGNAVPILVFEIDEDEDGYRYEAVYGHRRMEACRRSGYLVLAVVQEAMSAQEQARLQLVENEGQSRLSVIERGKQIASQLQQGVWPSVGTLAEKIGYTRTYAQHLKSIGEHLPDSLLLAHPEPTSINFRTAQTIVRMAKDEMPVLKKRIEELRMRKSDMTAQDATAFLLTGEIKVESARRRLAPVATIKRRRDGLQVTIRGLGTEQPAGLEDRLKDFLTGNGIDLKD